MSDFKEWSQLVLEEMKRNDRNHRDVLDKLDEQNVKLGGYNSTLERLTETVVHHVKRSDQHEEHLGRQDETIEDISGEVDGLKLHVAKAEPIIDSINVTTRAFKIIFSMKVLKWLITICTLVSAFVGTKYAVKEYNSSHKMKKK